MINIKTLKKHDRVKPRTAPEVEQKYKLDEIGENADEISKINKSLTNVENSLSNMNQSLGNKADKEEVTKSFNEVNDSINNMSTSLNNKVDKEAGKGLSSNDFTDTYINEINNNKSASHTHSNKSVLDTITTDKINSWDNAIKSNDYSLSSYAVSGLSILRSSCKKKNNRVCINFVGTLSMEANTTTKLFNLPSELCTVETRDFVIFGQSSNTTGYIGYGYLTSDGLLQVRFSQAISSYMRFSFTYDIN